MFNVLHNIKILCSFADSVIIYLVIIRRDRLLDWMCCQSYSFKYASNLI